MSGAASEAAISRIATKRRDLGAEDFGAYAFLVLSMLGWQEPAVLDFILDRADERIEVGL
jgi:hypothetical protein